MSRPTFTALISAMILLALPLSGQAELPWLVGVGKSDITGPAYGVGLMGYGEASQVAVGIHDRMWARAFLIADRASQKRVAVVVVSAAMVYGNVTREAVRRLRQLYGPVYEDGNILIVADHTHSANGGQGGHFIFSMSVHGYFPDAFEAMVGGIVDAVSQAHKSLAPGRVLVNQGELYNASANRALKAFFRNPEAISMCSVDPEMLVMKFEQCRKPVGMLGWFATHGVSFPMNNLLISSDNKGYAAALMEKEMGNDFVAAFPQTNAGDMTPNLFLNGTGPGSTPEESARIIGRRQYQMGSKLFAEATQELTGPLDWQHEYVDFSRLAVPESLTGLPHPVQTCPAVAGYAFAAGTRDGRPSPWNILFRDEEKLPRFPWTFISSWLTGLTPEISACHTPKVSLIALGAPHDFHYINTALNSAFGGSLPPEIANLSWAPQVIPVSLVQIGGLGLIGVPAEFTVVAGRRLKNTVKSETGDRFSNLVLAGYANDYSLYVTTPEEYQEQLYEAGATLFGPWTLPAYQSVFARLAGNLVEPGRFEPSRAVPDDLFRFYRKVDMPEFVCGGYGEYGRMLSSQPDVIWAGQKVRACFTATHPRLAIRRLKSFMTVEKQNKSHQWFEVVNDDDWDTRFVWQPDYSGSHSGEACVEWHVPYDAAPGTYRLGHHGIWRSPQGAMVPYFGYTKSFRLMYEGSGGMMLVIARRNLEKGAGQL
ncbi:neutral/alkaline non-lysosomal ceramidase N-terminal domain-containing protein [Sansalvadorimonas verongulae]|uniref:neutral/alkaline non-lysosomal ceramidase N-terminal domain-containing protein n=1 Tax=Sansalvadorimonas verongulae TaxID=2172824 RepID=UPI0012BC0622|nr:neutral/alkaline non-lysosomal ceramidase N-terminal domain-containing protein [Sansalvadorimonas verongulae]MTI12301.1 hypothetical protein [Sansalvadorimonas verongulae]